MNKTMKIVSIVGAGVLLAGAGAFVGSQAFPKEVEVPSEPIVKEVPVEVVKEVPVEKIVEVTKLVDNANLPTALKFIEDNVDEDVTMDYIQFEVDAKIDAEAYIRDNMVGMLKDDDYFEDGSLLDNYRTSEVTISKLYDAEILDRDFEDKDLTLKYEVKIKAKESGEDATYHLFEVTMPFENGKLVEDDIELSLV